jgi:putative DNA primase/helicase
MSKPNNDTTQASVLPSKANQNMVNVAEEYVKKIEATDSNKARAKKQGGKQQKDGPTLRLRELCEREDLSLFHDPNKEGYARVKRGDHYETFPLDSGLFRLFLRERYHNAHNDGIADSALDNQIETLKSRALFDGKKHPVYLRMGGNGKTKIEIDTGDDEWTSFHIDVEEETWRRGPHESYFRRPLSMLPLPEPQRGGSLDELRDFIPNIRSENHRALFNASLVMAQYPPFTAAYPCLVLKGEQEVGKTWLTRIVKSLIDPAEDELGTPMENPRDLIAATQDLHLLTIDNIDHVSHDFSNALCRLSTGSAHRMRVLYTNKENMIVKTQLPVILNGIGEILSRADLKSRSIFIDLDPLDQEQRRTELEFFGAWEKARPRILGALLDASHLSLRRRAEAAAKITRRFRLADFQEIAVAAEPLLCLRKGATVEAALREQRGDAHTQALDTPVGAALLKLLGPEGTWDDGTASDLYSALVRVADPHGKGLPKPFPANGQVLVKELKRMGPALREVHGIEAKPYRGHHKEKRIRVAGMPHEGDGVAIGEGIARCAPIANTKKACGYSIETQGSQESQKTATLDYGYDGTTDASDGYLPKLNGVHPQSQGMDRQATDSEVRSEG